VCALRTLLVGVSAALALPAVAGSQPSDCLIDPSPDKTIAAIFAGDSECDPNGDLVSSAADLTITAERAALPGCPSAGASLAVEVEERAGAEDDVAVEVSGDLVEPSCRTQRLAASYSLELECDPAGVEPCDIVRRLVPGVWRHRFSSRGDADPQLQYRRTLVTADPVRDRVRFTHFASSLTVTNRANAGDGTLRNALQSAAALPKPLLIRFHDLIFPAGVPTAINLDFQLTGLATNDVTIDGTDEAGDIGNRIIDARGLPFGALSITGARNHIVGMAMRNAGGSNRDVVRIDGPIAGSNVIERCVISDSLGGDGVSVDNGAGSAFDDTVNIIKDSEIEAAVDKGIKVTTGAHVRVEGCWVHDNINGGVQSTLGGNLDTSENLIEDNLGGTAQNGISVQGFDPISGSSSLFSQGDIVRTSGANGVAVRGFAVATIRDSYLGANGTSGLRVFNDMGVGAVVFAEGTTVACNGVDGAVAADDSRLDLGGGELGSGGNNALTQNNLPAGGANLRNATGNIVSAVNNQWENCGTDTTCNDAAIAARDLSDDGLRTVFAPAQAQRSLQPPIVTRVSPTKGRAGELLRIYGLRFNAIDGHFDERSCEDVVGRNQCIPLRGNCVRIDGIAAPVEAVTPTMLAVRWPFTCVEPVRLVVTVDHGSVGLASEPFTVCSNPSEPLAAD